MIEFVALFVLFVLAVVGWLWISFVLVWWIGHISNKPRPRYRRRGL